MCSVYDKYIWDLFPFWREELNVTFTGNDSSAKVSDLSDFQNIHAKHKKVMMKFGLIINVKVEAKLELYFVEFLFAANTRFNNKLTCKSNLHDK